MDGVILLLNKEMETLILAFFVLVAVLFIAEVFMKEAFSDMNSPGVLTWMAMSGNQGFEDYSEPPPEPEEDTSMADDTVNLSGGWINPVEKEEQGFENNYDEEEEEDFVSGGDMTTFSFTDLLASITSYGTEGMKGGRGICRKRHWHNHRCNKKHRHYHACNKKHVHNHRCRKAHAHRHRKPSPRTVQGLVPAGPGQSLADQYKLVNTPAAMQGKNFIKYKNGINPNDYIRKDSIPCYACTL
jgi:hypothetical protein